MDERRRLWNHPFVKALRGFLYFIIAYLALGLFLYFQKQDFYFSDRINYGLDQLADVGLCVVGLVVWLAFFAQFVLPVKTFGQRLKVVDRLVTYLLGGHGPAIFVENGRVRAHEGEIKRKGPGVVWLDSASAAVLRNTTSFTDTIGPGVHFTKDGEFIAATMDLHPLSQAVGPLDSDVGENDPFAVEKNENHPERESNQKRRWETSALTRDGIEVVAAIGVTFRIIAEPGEGGSRFGFNKENTQKAIRDSIVYNSRLDEPVWSVLPARMAVDIWREYLRKFRLSELFDTTDGRAETGLQVITSMVGKRLKQESVEVLDEFGRQKLKTEDEIQAAFNEMRRQGKFKEIEQEIDLFIQAADFNWQKMYRFLLDNKRPKEAEAFLEKQKSLEFEKLTHMGLKVNGANIKRVIFAPAVEEKIATQWTTTWRKNADKERDQVERNRKLAEIQGQDDAVREFAYEASREVSTVGGPLAKYHLLESLVHSTFKGLRRDPALLKRVDTEPRDLQDILQWLREKQGSDGSDGADKGAA